MSELSAGAKEAIEAFGRLPSVRGYETRRGAHGLCHAVSVAFALWLRVHGVENRMIRALGPREGLRRHLNEYELEVINEVAQHAVLVEESLVVDWTWRMWNSAHPFPRVSTLDEYATDFATLDDICGNCGSYRLFNGEVPACQHLTPEQESAIVDEIKAAPLSPDVGRLMLERWAALRQPTAEVVDLTSPRLDALSERARAALDGLLALPGVLGYASYSGSRGACYQASVLAASWFRAHGVPARIARFVNPKIVTPYSRAEHVEADLWDQMHRLQLASGLGVMLNSSELYHARRLEQHAVEVEGKLLIDLTWRGWSPESPFPRFSSVDEYAQDFERDESVCGTCGALDEPCRVREVNAVVGLPPSLCERSYIGRFQERMKMESPLPCAF